VIAELAHQRRADGHLTLWIDGVLRQTLTVANGTLRVEEARLGAVGRLDASTSGLPYVDDFVSRRSIFIGP
jgi:hypothetical protein